MVQWMDYHTEENREDPFPFLDKEGISIGMGFL